MNNWCSAFSLVLAWQSLLRGNIPGVAIAVLPTEVAIIFKVMDFPRHLPPFSSPPCGYSYSWGDLGRGVPVPFISCLMFVMFISAYCHYQRNPLWPWAGWCHLFTWLFSLFLVWIMLMSDIFSAQLDCRLLEGSERIFSADLASVMSVT